MPLSQEEKEWVGKWLLEADADLRRARQMAASPADYDAAAFFCQQATEKFVKAALLTQELSFPKTHDIPALLVLLSSHLSFSATDYTTAATLADYAVEVRYPGKRINMADLQAAVRIA